MVFAVSIVSSPNGSVLGGPLVARRGESGGGGSACTGGIGWAGAGLCAYAGDTRPNARTAAAAMARRHVIDGSLAKLPTRGSGDI